MEEQPNRTSTWITIAVAVPIFYVLSTGPVVWVLDKQLHLAEPPFWIKKFYYPLGLLADRWPAFNSAMKAYFHLWGLDP